VLHFEGINRKKERGRPWTGIKTDGGGSATRITTTTKATTTTKRQLPQYQHYIPTAKRKEKKVTKKKNQHEIKENGLKTKLTKTNYKDNNKEKKKEKEKNATLKPQIFLHSPLSRIKQQLFPCAHQDNRSIFNQPNIFFNAFR